MKTAARVSDTMLVHLFAAIIMYSHEKVRDLHGQRSSVLDPSGDNKVEEELDQVRGVGSQGQGLFTKQSLVGGVEKGVRKKVALRFKV